MSITQYVTLIIYSLYSTILELEAIDCSALRYYSVCAAAINC